MTAARRPRLAAALAVLAVLGLTACNSGQDQHAAARPAPSTSAAPVPPATVHAEPALDSTDVAPTDPLRVDVADGTLSAVTVTDPAGAPVPGQLDPAGTAWTATGELAYGTAYAVQAVAVDGAGRSTTTAGTITTVRPGNQTMPSVFPGGRSTVGVGQPVSVTFDEDVTDRAAVEQRLHVTTTPPVAGSWSWIDDRTVHYRPEQYWPAHTHVAVDVDTYGLDVGDGVYGQASKHVAFDVGAKKVGVVDGHELVLRLYVDDQLVRSMPTSLGKASDPTPTGTYVVMQQSRKYTMRSATFGVPLDAPGGYETPVDYASRLSNSGIFVHAAPWSVAQQGHRNVSHGCLNVSTADAGWFFDTFGRGDVVQVTGAGGPLPEWDGFGDWNTSWADWTAASALH
jgi:lipoprotein-anchoring transpeptidase ErfK/SrfK